MLRVSSEFENLPNDEESLQVCRAAETGDLEGVKVHVQQIRAQSDTTELLENSLKLALLAAICQKHPAIVSYLLDNGAKLNRKHVYCAVTDDTPTELFQVLLDHGWDINEQTDHGSPALKQVLYFFSRMVRNVELVRWFLAHGADPNIRGSWNELPITVACCNSTPEVVDLLIAHGASLHHSDALHLLAEDEDHSPQSIRMMSHLIDLGMDVNEISHTNREHRRLPYHTPLHSAVEFEFVEAITFLLAKGADPDIRDTSGRTPLECAIKYDDKVSIEAFEKYSPSSTFRSSTNTSSTA
ncbi:hypothetical protein MMC11_009102 [Xylographa trunciseda]|nr:hypothetical protein [Xylographa trunciseda]